LCRVAKCNQLLIAVTRDRIHARTERSIRMGFGRMIATPQQAVNVY